MAEPKGKILILVENLPVPFDRRVWMESLALTEAGYQVSVISPQPPSDPEPNKVIEGIHVYRYPLQATSSGISSYIVEYRTAMSETKRLMKQVNEEVGFDVIQTCNPPDLFWILAKPWKKRGKGFVFDHHDLCPELYVSRFGDKLSFAHQRLYKMQYWLERKTYETADMVIATNQSYKDIAIQRGRKHPDDVAIVRSGPQLHRFKRVEPDQSLKKGRKYLAVYLGVMGPQDGVDIAVRAADAIIKKHNFHDITFTFVGGGDCLEDLKNLAEELKITDYVNFTGRVSDEDLMRYLSSADIGMAPDPKNPLNDVSTMNKIIEYMAMGVPIVSFDLRESKYSAQDAAVYVQPNDEDLFAKAIIDLLQDEPKRLQMSEIGRQRVEEHLAWDHSRKALVAAYDRLFNKLNLGNGRK